MQTTKYDEMIGDSVEDELYAWRALMAMKRKGAETLKGVCGIAYVKKSAN